MKSVKVIVGKSIQDIRQNSLLQVILPLCGAEILLKKEE